MINNVTFTQLNSPFPGYIKNNQTQQAIDLFQKIKKPDQIILNLFFNACAQEGTNKALDLVKQIYEEMSECIHSNSYVLTSLMDAFMRCGDVSNAELVFNRSPKKEMSMYGAMMKGKIHQLFLQVY